MLSQEGIKFDPSMMYMLANDHNYEEEKIEDGGEADEEAGPCRFDEKEEKERRKKRKEMVKDRETFSIYNMKAVAQKMTPPGFAHYDSEDEDSDE